MECPDQAELVDELLDHILTQYRESPNLIAVIKAGLDQIAETAVSVCGIPAYFDVLTAGGDQLTILGKRLGWPRCHCVCEVTPVFGFTCGSPNPNIPIVGFCAAGSWGACQAEGAGDICLNDDEVYRGFLLARRYQTLQRYQIDDLQTAMQHIWGPTATATNMGGARVSLSPGRALSSREELEMPLAIRVLPVAPGIEVYVSRTVGLIAGFGDGWGGFCEGAVWLCPEPFNAYECA